MNSPTPRDATATPRHLYWIGLMGLLFSAVGALDFTMTQTHNVEYLAGFTPEQREFYDGFPGWVVAAWAVAVWGSLIGCLCLLARRRVAVPLLACAFVGTTLTTVHNFGLSNGMEVMGSPTSLALTGLILLVAFGLWGYARRMASRNVLR